jgi:hypothetical protein
MDTPLETVDTLEILVQREVKWYGTSSGQDVNIYYLEEVEQKLYSVMVVPRQSYYADKKPFIMLAARIIADKVVIYHDITDKPLFKALLEAGIPREQIILRYRGEVAPDPPEDRGHVETVE